ncbi:hypothetical protein GGS20DRAFT_460701 [Poronia punctata]|nr:hypothetical protein GGS20DRAFT_460701 [Poronia punctata]
MDFAPYQSSPPEHNRPFSPPIESPRASLDYIRRTSFSPVIANNNNNVSSSSPPPLQHPQPQRSWHNAATAAAAAGYADEEAGGAGGGGYGVVGELDTSLGIRLDYEAVLAYIGLPPLGGIILLILEKQSDYVR